jgi:hypothetical protein
MDGADATGLQLGVHGVNAVWLYCQFYPDLPLNEAKKRVIKNKVAGSLGSVGSERFIQNSEQLRAFLGSFRCSKGTCPNAFGQLKAGLLEQGVTLLQSFVPGSVASPQVCSDVRGEANAAELAQVPKRRRRAATGEDTQLIWQACIGRCRGSRDWENEPLVTDPGLNMYSPGAHLT